MFFLMDCKSINLRGAVNGTDGSLCLVAWVAGMARKWESNWGAWAATAYVPANGMSDSSICSTCGLKLAGQAVRGSAGDEERSLYGEASRSGLNRRSPDAI